MAAQIQAMHHEYWPETIRAMMAAGDGPTVIARKLKVARSSVYAALKAARISQIGYVLGLALLVPSGDLQERRGLISLALLVTAAGLVVAALAPGFAVFAAALALSQTYRSKCKSSLDICSTRRSITSLRFCSPPFRIPSEAVS